MESWLGLSLDDAAPFPPLSFSRFIVVSSSSLLSPLSVVRPIPIVPYYTALPWPPFAPSSEEASLARPPLKEIPLFFAEWEKERERERPRPSMKAEGKRVGGEDTKDTALALGYESTGLLALR